MPATVYKKQSPNNRITLYLSTREFVHEGNHVTPIDGVILLDPLYMKDRKLFAMVVLTFRYGREDEEVMGLKFFTEAILDFKQIYPSEPYSEDELTCLQQSLIRKLGTDAYPLTLRVSAMSPPSVRLRPARVYAGSPLGVNYDLKVFVGEKADDKPHKRSTIRMTLCCMQYDIPEGLVATNPPSASVSKTFVFSPGKLGITTMLDREVYHHGDPIHVHVTINNNSNRSVHKVKVYVVQHVNVCMFTNGRFKNIVGSAETEDRHPIAPGASLSRDFCIRPKSVLKFPVALALEGGFHEGDPDDLASSTLVPQPKEKNPYGVIVSYEVKVKALMGCMDRSVTVHLPFKLLGERPPEEACGGVSHSTCKQDVLEEDIIETDDVTCDEIARYVLLNS